MAAHRTRVFGVAAKIETVSGTDSVPTFAANGVRVVGIPLLTIADLEPGLRDDVQSGALIPSPRAIPAGRIGTIDIVMEVMGAGAVYSASVKPPHDVFLRGAGFLGTGAFGAGVEKHEYTSLDDGMETFSMYLEGAAKLFKLIGCVCAPKLTAAVNGRALFTFSVRGRLVTSPADAAFSAPTLTTVIPPLFHSQSVAIGTWDSADADPLIARSAELDFNTTIVDRPSAGHTDGLVGFLITDRRARLTMEVEHAGTLATFDPYAAARAGGAAVANAPSFTIGTVQYNRMKVQGGGWALEEPGHGDSDGLHNWSLQGNLYRDAALLNQREAVITFD